MWVVINNSCYCIIFIVKDIYFDYGFCMMYDDYIPQSNPISLPIYKASKLNAKLNPTTVKFRFYYIKSQAEVRNISKNLDLDQSVVLVLTCTTFLCYI